MTRPLLDRGIGELFHAIDACRDRHLVTPCLILIYSMIDTLASLSRPATQADVTRQDFVAWVDTYLMPNLTFSGTALELYAARCGLVHTYMPGSRLHREGQARQVWYTWGTGIPAVLDTAIQQSGQPAVTLHVDGLVTGLTAAYQAFLGRLDTEAPLAALVYGRVGQFFCNVPAA